MAAPSKSDAFLAAVEARRSYYGLSDASPISDEKVLEIITEAVKHSPTAFNNQSTAVIYVHGEKHQQVWDLIVEKLTVAYAGNDYALDRLNTMTALFKKAHGTIIFFEDDKIIKELAEKFAAFASSFPLWQENAAGMLQFVVWTALEAEGLGASLQHHGGSPVANKALLELFNLPETWRSTAMMPIGTPVGPPGNPDRAKTFDNLEQRIRVFA